MHIPPIRTPSPRSNGAKLQRRYSNDNGYVDNPIENSSTQAALATASDKVKHALKGVDLTHIRPTQLAKLASTLFAEGQISDISAGVMIVQQVDGDAPINLLQVLKREQGATQCMKGLPLFKECSAGYAEVEATTSKLADFIRALTSSAGVDVRA
jgi:hypothetical protein